MCFKDNFPVWATCILICNFILLTPDLDDLKFYNLRPFPGETWKAEKVADHIPMDQEVRHTPPLPLHIHLPTPTNSTNPQACQALVTLKTHEGTVGYDTLWQALTSLVGYGMELRQHDDKPQNVLIVSEK